LDQVEQRTVLLPGQPPDGEQVVATHPPDAILARYGSDDDEGRAHCEDWSTCGSGRYRHAVLVYNGVDEITREGLEFLHGPASGPREVGTGREDQAMGMAGG
jgi:hypothetical protein